MYLISACLADIACAYDGKSRPNKKVIDLLHRECVVPICPEQLGGLTTPRKQAEIADGKVVTIDGNDVTPEFEKGAEEVLNIAKRMKCHVAILKQRSPSCGCGEIYDGTFSKNIVKGDGLLAKLLKENGIRVISDEEF